MQAQTKSPGLLLACRDVLLARSGEMQLSVVWIFAVAEDI